MNVSPDNIIETLVTHSICNPAISLNEKKTLIMMGDSLINWIKENENKAVQPPEDDVSSET